MLGILPRHRSCQNGCSVIHPRYNETITTRRSRNAGITIGGTSHSRNLKCPISCIWASSQSVCLTTQLTRITYRRPRTAFRSDACWRVPRSPQAPMTFPCPQVSVPSLGEWRGTSPATLLPESFEVSMKMNGVDNRVHSSLFSFYRRERDRVSQPPTPAAAGSVIRLT